MRARAAQLKHNAEVDLGAVPDEVTFMVPKSLQMIASMETLISGRDFSENLVSQGLQLVNEIADEASSLSLRDMDILEERLRRIEDLLRPASEKPPTSEVQRKQNVV